MPGRVYRPDELRIPEPEVLQWEDFQVMFQGAHKQGEHVAIVGPTGSGKTVLGIELCRIIGSRIAEDKRPSRVTILQFKPRDDTLKMLIPDWPVIKEWPPSYGQEHCIVWPRSKTPSKAARLHRAVFLPLIDTIYNEGSQTIYVPEAAYFERPLPKGLGMAPTMENLWSTARSLKLTVVSDTQRPTHVTRLMWSEPAWLMIYPPDDEEDLKRVAQLSGEKVAVLNIVPRLGEHEFLCVRRQRHAGQRALYVSRPEIVTHVTRNKRN